MHGDSHFTIQEIKRDSLLYHQAVSLRYALFFEALGLPKSIVHDEKEAKSFHYSVSKDDTLVAYGRLSETDVAQMQISQMVVSPEFQRQGHGESLLRYMIEQAKSTGVRKLHLAARLHAVPLYTKLGFETIGEPYNSVLTDVAHIKMVNTTD
ncbi:GNAT family N-acetyltransferase [Enterovibrio coralii]|uniref:N-acetyltransferase domain-containing protein n=1 Tax=Enterovibrio coralii TaxID=294935 RepID=A0A135I5S9_9GAMM|nr:GNAT family N-acetyltransferase [Enterovibrio coralii]KXF80744.1 hypothetical protein ATN88_15765 [Enterovibrio coralii]